MNYLLLITRAPPPPRTRTVGAALVGRDGRGLRRLLLAPPESATTVRVENGKALTTDGPFVAIQEALGGYFVLEADDLDTA